jgi:hypothetical protein
MKPNRPHNLRPNRVRNAPPNIIMVAAANHPPVSNPTRSTAARSVSIVCTATASITPVRLSTSRRRNPWRSLSIRSWGVSSNGTSA